MAESRLDVVINPSRAQAGARAVKSSIDIMKSSWVEFTAKAFLAEQAITRVWGLANKGADFEESMERLNIQMDRFHSTGQLMINDLKAITNGQLSNAQAAMMASRALGQGMDPDQIRVFTQAADLLGDVMGKDLKSAFDEIMQGLATGRTQVLANIGVYLDLEKEVKNLAVSTNRTTEQITKQEKAAIGARAVMDQLGKQLDKFSSQTVSDADKMKALEARCDDLQLAASRFAKELVVGTADVLGGDNSAMDYLRSFGDMIDRLTGKAQTLKSLVPDIFLAPSETAEGQVMQEVLGRAIVADAQGRMKRQAEAEAKRKRDAANQPLDSKLLRIREEGSHDRIMQSIDAAEAQQKLLGEERIDAYKNYVAEHLQTGLDLLKEEKRIAQQGLEDHIKAIDRKIAEEGRFHQATAKLGYESTEEKFKAEEEFGNKLTELLIERHATEKQWHTQTFAFNHKIMEEEAKAQEALGQRITDSLISNFQIGEDVRHREQDETLKHFQSLAKFQEAYGASRENVIRTQYDIVRANLAKELDVNFETAAKVLDAWRNSDEERAQVLLEGSLKTQAEITAIWQETMAQQREVSEKFSDDFFTGFAKSMRRYVDDNSMLGLGVDQARRVAQGMEQGFQQFFFDAMEGRVQSLKDIFSSLLDFTKQMLSQMAGALLTNSILGALTSGAGGGLFGGGASPVSWLPSHRNGGIAAFASGGIAHRPMLRWAGGGMNLIAEGAGSEAYVPLPDGRSIPVTMEMKNPGRYAFPHAPAPEVSVPISIQVVNQHDTAQVETQRRTGPNGTQEIKVFIKQAVSEAITRGDLDPALNARFGSRPQLVRR